MPNFPDPSSLSTAELEAIAATPLVRESHAHKGLAERRQRAQEASEEEGKGISVLVVLQLILLALAIYRECRALHLRAHRRALRLLPKRMRNKYARELWRQGPWKNERPEDEDLFVALAETWGHLSTFKLRESLRALPPSWKAAETPMCWKLLLEDCKNDGSSEKS